MKTKNYHFKKGDLQICIQEQKEHQVLYFVETVPGAVETMTGIAGIVETLSNDLSLEKMVGLHFPTSEAGHGCGMCFGQRGTLG